MNKLAKGILALIAGAAAVFAHLFIKERMDFGSSYERPGRWY